MANAQLALRLAPVVGLLVIPALVSAQMVPEPVLLPGSGAVVGEPMLVGDADPIVTGPPIVIGDGVPYPAAGPVAPLHLAAGPREEGERPRGTGDLIWPTLHERGWQALRSFVPDDAARQERLDTADTLFRAALEHLRPFRPGDDRVATTYIDLAWVFFLRERYDDARPLADWALQERLARLGPYNPLVGDSLILLSRIAVAQERYDVAESLARRALTAYTRSSPGKNLDFHTPIALDTLGQVYLQQSKLDLADAYIRRGLEWRQELIQRMFFDPQKDPMAYSEMARSYLLLASVVEKLGKDQEAAELRNEAANSLNSAAEAYANRGAEAGMGDQGAAPAPGPMF